MRAIIAGCVMVVGLLGVVVAEEFTGLVTKVEVKDGKTTISGTKGKGDEAKEFTLTVAKDVKVNKGTKKKGDEKFTVGDPIEGGLTSDLFKNASTEKGKGVACSITTEKDIVTQILVTKGKKKAD